MPKSIWSTNESTTMYFSSCNSAQRPALLETSKNEADASVAQFKAEGANTKRYTQTRDP
jgi:hypothetical protein